jgi:hypothetical protein
MTALTGKKQILIFVRYPERGRVKTRLAQSVGDEAAGALYSAFVCDVLIGLRSGGYLPTIFYTPPEAASLMVGWLGNDFTYEAQRGDDLGSRMYDAFQRSLSRYKRVVLVGSDSPDLPPSIIDEAFHGLASHDMVLGPASDGGYYLIGFTSGCLVKEVFQGLNWGSYTVFEDTLSISRKQGLNVHILPPWNDIDDIDDLRLFFERHKDKGRNAFTTLTYLHDHPEIFL